jgi:hypothetical protein
MHNTPAFAWKNLIKTSGQPKSWGKEKPQQLIRSVYISTQGDFRILNSAALAHISRSLTGSQQCKQNTGKTQFRRSV